MVKFVDKDNAREYEGRISIYKDRIAHDKNKSFIELDKEIAHSVKVGSTLVMSESIKLLYYREKGDIYVSENSLPDKFKLANKVKECFDLIGKALR